MTKLIALFVSANMCTPHSNSGVGIDCIHPCLVDEVGTGTVRLVLVDKFPGSGVSPEASYWIP